MTVLAADYLWSYRCNLKGCCCNAGWRIGLVDDDLNRLSRAAAGTVLAPRVEALATTRAPTSFAGLIRTEGEAKPHKQRKEIGELPKDDRGACAFVEADGRCEIHGTLGEAALPRVCQSFPVLAGHDGDVTRTTWELLCPEVTRALADATTPAHIVAAPPLAARSFIADPWNDADAALPIMGAMNSTQAPRAYETMQATAGEAALFRDAVAEALRIRADVPIVTLAAALAELNRWARTGRPRSREDLVASLTNPPDDVAVRAATLAVTEAARRRFLIIASERQRVQRTTRLCQGFFAHHPWGVDLTLAAVDAAFAHPDGPLTGIRADSDHPAEASFGPEERLVFANAAIAHQSLASAVGDSLLGGLAHSLIVLVDALFFRFLFAPPKGPRPPTPAEYAATALALADTLHRGKDAGTEFFTDLLRHLARSPAVLALAEVSIASPVTPTGGLRSIGAVVLSELRHRRAAARTAAGWYGRLVADWRDRMTAATVDPQAALTTPGLPLTADAPHALKLLQGRAEVALLALGVAVSTDASLPSAAAMHAPLIALLPDFTPAELADAIARLTERGSLASSPRPLTIDTASAFDVACAVDPALLGAVLGT